MLDFSLDQHGSRFIQLKLDTLSPEDLAAAFRWGGCCLARLLLAVAELVIICLHLPPLYIHHSLTTSPASSPFNKNPGSSPPRPWC
jgi:hypothetical protein